MNTWTYRLDYTLHTDEQQQTIKGDVVQFDEPQSNNDILIGLVERWVLVRDENVSIGSYSVELLSPPARGYGAMDLLAIEVASGEKGI